MNQMFTSIKINGEEKRVLIDPIPALDGYELRGVAVKVMMNGLKGGNTKEEQALRREFALRVLAYASVEYDESTVVPLDSADAIDAHVPGGMDVEHIINEVLSQNGLPVEVPLAIDQYWDAVGKQVAATFIASCSVMIDAAMAAKTE
jgi:hypothetical protein